MADLTTQAAAVANWAVKKAKPANTPAYRRLTDADRVLALQLAERGNTQTVIAQQLGVTQSSISQWLSHCQDSTKPATQYLRGSALRMARNIVQKGRAADHIKALEGINVLAPEHVAGITVQIGIKADTVKLVAPLSPASLELTSETVENS